MKSRTVIETGFYEIEFNSQGIHLEKVDHPIPEPSKTWWLKEGQYVNGHDWQTLSIIDDLGHKLLTNHFPQPGNIIFNPGITTSPRISSTHIDKLNEIDQFWDINSIYGQFGLPKLDSEKSQTKHTCSYFKWYYGLVEHYEYCVSCEKKR